MANYQLSIPSKVILPVKPSCCQQVVLCLGESWDSLTVNGGHLVYATLNNITRTLLPSDPSRCQDEIIYSVTIDDTQFLIDERTETRYRPTCEDILEIMPYSCTIDALQTLIGNFQILSGDELPDPVSPMGTFFIVTGSLENDGLYISKGDLS